MPRPRGRPRTKKIITEETVAVEEREDYRDLDLSEYMEGIGATSREIKVFRVVGARQKWVATVDDPKLITEEAILEQWGPGRYLIRAKDADGHWLRCKMFEIEGAEPQPAINPYAPIPNGNSEAMERIFAMMQQSQQQTHEMLIALITKGNGAPAFDPTVAMTSMVTAMGSIQGMMPKPNGDELDRVSKILEIAERVGGNGGPKGTMESILDAAKDILPAIMAARGMAPQQVAVTEIEELKALPETSSPAIDEKGGSVVKQNPPNDLATQIKERFLMIERAAQKDLDPEAWAGFLLDQEEIEDQAASIIVESILQSETFEVWEKQTGSIKPELKSWFGRFHQAVREAAQTTEQEPIHGQGKSEGTSE